MLEHPILERHFLIVTINELNNDLAKNNKPYRINFSDITYSQFVEVNKAYQKKNNFYNDDDNLNINKIFDHLDYFKKLVTSFTDADKLYLIPENIQNDLYQLML